MAETIHLKDGRTEVIFDTEKQLEELIREALGDDVVRYLRALNAEYEARIKCLVEDAAEKESIADGYIQLCNDACDSFQHILYLLDGPRLNRETLQTATRNAYNALHANL